MAELTLKEYLDTTTQEQAAQALGVTQGAISHMLRGGRDIRISTLGSEIIAAHEIKPVGKMCRFGASYSPHQAMPSDEA